MTALELMSTLGEVDEELVLPVLAAPARRLRRKALRIALIAAAVLALLALAALAASESGLLERYFPGSYDLISDYVTHVEAVTENDILRLTLHEAVTDGARTLVAYTVERLDGGGMAGWEPEAEITPHYMGGRAFSGGSRSGTTIDQSETAKRTYLWYCSSTDETALESVSIRLLGLKSTVNRGEQLDAGSLTLEASLNACPVRMAKRLGSAADEDLVVSVRISPLSLRILSYRNLAGMKPGDVEKKEDIHTVGGPSDRQVELLFRDDSRQHVSMRHRSTDSSGIVVLMGDFWDLPDVSRVKAVVIDGREYPLTKETAPAPRQGLGRDAPFLESQRAWLYGNHELAHPDLKASGEGVTLALDGIWTDGYTTELMLQIDAPHEDYWEPVNTGGKLTFDARDRQGEALAVGVRDCGLVQGLLSLIVECSDQAAQLTIGDGDASLVIPLDMKKLKKLPQIEPREAAPRQTASPDAGENYRQSVYETLFAGVTPDDTGYSADNGIYRLTAVCLYLAEEPGIVRLRAWIEASRLDGKPYSMAEEARRAFAICGLKDGEEVLLNGGLGHQGGVIDGVRYFSVSEDYRYGDFAIADAQGAGVLPAEGLDLETLDLDGLRLTWTPPEGGRITLDLNMSG